MLTACLEIVIALLAALGLATLIWLAFGRLLTPPGNEEGRTLAVVEAAGDGGGLEQTVHSLVWLSRGELWHYRIVIVDRGLTRQGRSVARRLCAGTRGVAFYTPQELARYFQSEGGDLKP